MEFLRGRLIIGNYNTKTGIVELNPYFEAEISEEFKKELDARFKETKKLAEERQRRNADSPFGFINNQTGGSEAVEEDESAEEVDWDDSDWD